VPVTLLASLRRYADHPDPATAMANTVAMVVGANGPFYPLYVWWLLPEAGLVSLLTMFATPFFLSVPWISRRNGLAGRIALVVVGLANTVWCTALLGPATGVGLFVLPCLMLAGLVWAQRAALFALLGLGLAAQQVVLRWPWPALSGLALEHQAALYVLNASSVAMLLGFLAIVSAGQVRQHLRR
jgi:hypothetical protein